MRARRADVKTNLSGSFTENGKPQRTNFQFLQSRQSRRRTTRRRDSPKIFPDAIFGASQGLEVMAW
jgi:hypothetical protein